MSEREKLEEIANRIDTNQRGWLPIAGHIVNVTFDLNEADLVSRILRSHDRLISALRTIAEHGPTMSDFPHDLEEMQNFARTVIKFLEPK
jgi:predicted metal-dependent phosphoesterase TrpH